MSETESVRDRSGYIAVDLGRELRDSFLSTCLEQGTTPFDAMHELAEKVVRQGEFPVTVDPAVSAHEERQGEGRP